MTRARLEPASPLLERRSGRLMLGIALSLPLLYAVIIRRIILVNDEGDYSSSAYLRATDAFTSAKLTIFDTRVGLTVPLAWLYRMFGASHSVDSILPLLGTVWLLLVVYRFGARLHGPMAGGAAALLLTLSGQFLFHTPLLYPDIPLAAGLVTAVYLVFEARKTGRKTTGVVLMALAAASWNGAFLFKETIVSLFPGLVLVALLDLRARRFVGRWLVFGGTFVALLGVHLVLYKLSTGAYLTRFAANESGHNAAHLLINFHSWRDYARRLLLDLPMWLLARPGSAALTALAMPSLFGLFSSKWRRDGDEFLGFVVLGVTVFYWFGSSSMTHYVPLLIDPRNLIPMFALMAPLAGGAFQSVWRAEPTARPIMTVVATILMLAVPVQALDASRPQALVSLFWALLVIGLIFAWRVHERFRHHVFAALPMILLAMGGVHQAMMGALKRDMFYPDPAEQGYRSVFERQIARLSHDTIVYTEPLAFNVLRLLDRYSPTGPELRVKSDSELGNTDADSVRRTLVFVPWGHMKWRYINFGEQIPDYVVHPPASWRLLDEEGDVRLYEITGALPVPHSAL